MTEAEKELMAMQKLAGVIKALPTDSALRVLKYVLEMTSDRAEAKAINQAYWILRGQDSPSRQRALRWAIEFYRQRTSEEKVPLRVVKNEAESVQVQT